MAHRSTRRTLWTRALRVTLGVAVGFFSASLFVQYRYQDRIVQLAEAPSAPVALVFGAGLAAGKEPSPILAQRLDTAIALYRAGKVKKLIVSGDNLDRHHDEPAAMKRYAVEGGVNAGDVVADDAGISTYDSCARARTAFGVERALLISQRFHLPRAVFIANSLGIDAWGVPSDPSQPTRAYYALRELFSRPLALAMVIARPEPESPTQP